MNNNNNNNREETTAWLYVTEIPSVAAGEVARCLTVLLQTKRFVSGLWMSSDVSRLARSLTEVGSD